MKTGIKLAMLVGGVALLCVSANKVNDIIVDGDRDKDAKMRKELRAMPAEEISEHVANKDEYGDLIGCVGLNAIGFGLVGGAAVAHIVDYIKLKKYATGMTKMALYGFTGSLGLLDYIHPEQKMRPELSTFRDMLTGAQFDSNYHYTEEAMGYLRNERVYVPKKLMKECLMH